MCLAFVAAYFALEAEIKRRKLNIDPYNVIAIVAIAGILGAKVWHVVDTPADRLTPEILKSIWSVFGWFRGGFAWFGGFVAGITTLLLLARKYRVSMLTMLDVASSAAAIGYAVGRIGCLVSGDGDYGIRTSLPWGMSFPNGLVPTLDRVHPTPIYEFLAGVLIFWYIWRRGTRAIQHPQAAGVITGEFLILSGIERFLVEFIRINRLTQPLILGMSNAQLAALLTAIAGAILLIVVRRRFRGKDPVHKVLDHVT